MHPPLSLVISTAIHSAVGVLLLPPPIIVLLAVFDLFFQFFGAYCRIRNVDMNGQWGEKRQVPGIESDPTLGSATLLSQRESFPKCFF